MDKLQKYLSQVQDFRISRHKLYPLEEILFLIITSCICGSYTFEEIEDFGNSRLAWLRKYYPYSEGIPSHDTINRVLSHLSPNLFNEVFMSWVKSMLGEKEPDVINIDGKALCGTAPRLKSSKKLIHEISAWANEASLVLGQTSVIGKGNEISGILALLELLDIEDDIVTIDAIGCQTQIIETIIDKGAHYVIGIKANQKILLEETENAFNKIDIKDIDNQVDATGGRVHTRICKVIHHLETFIPQAAKFKNAKSVILIESTRFDKTTQKNTIEKRYYLSDLDLNAKYFNQVIRSHWDIENKLHWHLDVTMHEDKDRKRAKNLASNFSLIRKFALNILSKFKQNQKKSMQRIQKMALMSDEYLQNTLF
jgi:predicted transposase YbfD/YdcC